MNSELETPNAERPALPPVESSAVATLAAKQNMPTATPARRRRSVPPEKAGLLLIGEAAAQLRCSVKTVRNLVKAGRLPVIRLTQTRTDPMRFRLLDVQRLINACEEVRGGKGQ